MMRDSPRSAQTTRKLLENADLTDCIEQFLSIKTVSRWIGGTTQPRLRDLRRIRELFGEFPLP